MTSVLGKNTMMIKVGKHSARWALRKMRRHGRNNLFWWQGPPYNAGDWVGPFLFKAITSQDPVYVTPSNRSWSTVFVTCGSLTRWICEDSIVWGSGLLDRDERLWRPYEVCAVRGPYTRQRLLEHGYPCPAVYGDPAILLPRFLQCSHVVKYRVGIVPHYSSIKDVQTLYGSVPEITVIDIRQPLEQVIRSVTSCAKIISSSLHGLIFAHSYGIPAARVDFVKKPGGDGVKFMDYFVAGGVASPPTPLIIENNVPISVLEQYVDGSPQPNLDPLKDRLLEACPFLPN